MPSEWNQVARHCLSTRFRPPRLVLKLLNTALQKNLIGSIDSDCYNEIARHANRSESGLVSHVLRELKLHKMGSSLFDYPLLLNEIYLERQVSTQSRTKAPHYQSASSLLANTGSFETRIVDLLHQSKVRGQPHERPAVAVVGNAPDILNRQQGREIDSADVVIRFNQTGLSERTAVDIGRRTDVWIMSPSKKLSLCPTTASAIVVSGIHPITRPSGYWTALAHIEKALGEFGIGIWYDLVKLFDAPPTAGALTLASLQAMSMNLDVRCYGFTFDYKAHGTTANHHADNQSRSTRHNWRAESAWLLENYR